MIPLSIVRVVYYAQKNGNIAMLNITLPKSLFKTEVEIDQKAVNYIHQHLASAFLEYIQHKYPDATFKPFTCTIGKRIQIMDCETMDDNYPDPETRAFWQSRWFVSYEVILSEQTASDCFAFSKTYAQKAVSMGNPSKPLSLDTGLTVVMI